MSSVTIRRPARAAAGKRGASGPALRQAFLYARVSSREQEREGYSIAAQQTLIRQYASNNGFAIIREFVDVETAKKTGRKAFTEMLSVLKRKKDSGVVVLVEKTDRLYRNLKDWVTLDETGVDVHFVKEGIVISEGSRSSEKFIHGIKVLMAKNYVDNLSEEVRKGVNQKCVEGGYPGRAPLGYRNRRVNGKAVLEVDTDSALLVRRFFEQYDAGTHSVEELAAYAAAAGAVGRQGGRISPSLIHSVLRNPLYAGEFSWGGTIYDSVEPCLISWDLFSRVQNRLDGFPYTRATERTFAYSGLVTCGHCGSAITAEIKKERYIYYHCARICRKERFLTEARLEALFQDEVARLRFPEELRAAFVASLRSSRRDVEEQARARGKEAQQRVERFGRLIEAAYVDKLEGRIDEAFFHTKRGEWEIQRAEAAEEVAALGRASAKSMDTAIQVFELANKAFDLMKSREPREQRKLLEVLISNSTFADGKLTVTWRKPLDYLANSPVGAQTKNTDLDCQDRRHSVWSGGPTP